MTPIQLNQQRADIMEALYHASGRINGLYTGLWQEFCHDIGRNFRDTDFAELHAACMFAIGETESHLGEKHAQQCIRICRKFLLGERWG